VLPYSNWQWATRCQSESLLSLRAGLQAALFRLGKVPKLLQIDNSSAATYQISGEGKRDFNPEFLSLAEHHGLAVRTIHVRCPNENGDVESHNGHLKRRLEQHLLLRGHRDFASEDRRAFAGDLWSGGVAGVGVASNRRGVRRCAGLAEPAVGRGLSDRVF
jgi:transposase